jgi:hypothetical protein
MKIKIDYQKINTILENPNVIQATLGLFHNWLKTYTPIYFNGVRIYDTVRFIDNPNAIVPYDVDLPTLMVFYKDGHIDTTTAYYYENVTEGQAPNDECLEGLQR